ncbi:hypothetical protein D7D52_36035 [Nocardia yunnanensis]|uniref:Uncharacterized protein n=1 Tax=Nocardia yunnanensis TaxID=2382165 RepID=A0A386ZMB2_9NOCA|nr:hypothetical protein [Nocardia yunnanensis]AYF78350.1 hypothetical protein D7D52_36035 [Nocardia yunnanensis]
MTETNAETVDFVVLHPDGQLTRHTRESTPLNTAIRGHVVRPHPDASLGTQGMGRLRAWYDDEFAGSEPGIFGGGLPPLPPNPLADRVLRGIGYKQPPGFWRGTVALSMEERPYGGGTDPLTAEALATLEDLATPADSDPLAVLRRHVPELLTALRYKHTVLIDDREVHEYEHLRTHRLISLEASGQAWWIATREDGLTLARPWDLDEAKAFVQEFDDPSDQRA